jgi:predicted nicotinamide N-methyase
MMDPRAIFVRSHTTLATAPLVPEVPLHLASDSQRIFQRAAEAQGATGSPFQPYWAFAWPGGQAIARYLIDHPSLVAGKRVIDIGSGSGIGAIAAVEAGARSVLAVDIDPLAETAIRLNGILNDCSAVLSTSTEDVLGDEPDADVVLISDLVYEPELATRVGRFLDGLVATGHVVLLGDRATARQPASGLEEIARYHAPLAPALIDDSLEEGRVWRFRARARGQGTAP